MRLIDADRLKEHIINPPNAYLYRNVGMPQKDILKIIDLEPTVEKPHGDWNWDGKAVKREMYIRECLHCKTKCAVGNFCMWCGAKMEMTVGEKE